MDWPALMDREQAAAYLGGISLTSLRALTDRKAFPKVFVLSMPRYRRADIDAFIKHLRVVRD
ncbi:helix-turn-helix domain-containing protein [Nakamurella sp. YIM 132087]|uniref:Helix-turn-helix domain-containing protein n=1 Tax=Nakamurella alba TaxID=2665158 RepID=A0A7K1FWA7_9ACTN|nr:helix-turn-helix domain-containing protein [Nakamurella alba]MTD17503.1 helix-turn-helix domain-containing protein [Nakamurella alba]